MINIWDVIFLTSNWFHKIWDYVHVQMPTSMGPVFNNVIITSVFKIFKCNTFCLFAPKMLQIFAWTTEKINLTGTWNFLKGIYPNLYICCILAMLTKLNLMVRLQLWSSEEQIVPLHCHYSQIQPHLEC